jgi:hypothetical protein
MPKDKSHDNKNKGGNSELSAEEPLEKIYIDICGPFQETFRRKKYIIAIIDQFSRYISLTAVAKQDEETVKETILKKWILRFGAPREIHVDCGKVFESKVIKDLVGSMGIALCFSSPYHHNTNGIIERQFRTIRDAINTSMKEKKWKDWEATIPYVEFMMNATFQKSIGKSPAEIIYGRKIYKERWYGRNHTILVERTKEDSESRYPTRRSFNIGDQVLVKVEMRTKDKDRYEGPYRVVQKIHDRRYLLQPENGKAIPRNVEKMRKFLKEGGCEDISQ